MSEFFRKPIVKTLMLKGQEGQSIKGIEKTSTNGFVDTYTITLTDGTTSTFTVTNGREVSSIKKTGTSGLVDTYTIKFNDGTTSTFTITNGKAVSSIKKTKTSGLVDTYTIKFNDGTESTFTVTNGKTDYKPAVDALGKRIDNLILSSGTESSAEIADARTGYDGTTYDTLGAAIRAQVNKLNNGIGELDGAVFNVIQGIKDYTSNATILYDKFVSLYTSPLDGKILIDIIDKENICDCYVIPVNENDRFQVKGLTHKDKIYYYPLIVMSSASFADNSIGRDSIVTAENGNYSYWGYEAGIETYEFVIPKGVKTLIVNNFDKKLGFSINKYVEEKISKIPTKEEINGTLVNSLVNKYSLKTGANVTEGKYINGSGQLGYDVDYFVTDYIPINKDDCILSFENVNTQGIYNDYNNAFYDENHVFIRTFSANKLVRIPQNAKYIRCSFNKNIFNDIYFTTTSYYDYLTLMYNTLKIQCKIDIGDFKNDLSYDVIFNPVRETIIGYYREPYKGDNETYFEVGSKESVIDGKCTINVPRLSALVIDATKFAQNAGGNIEVKNYNDITKNDLILLSNNGGTQFEKGGILYNPYYFRKKENIISNNDNIMKSICRFGIAYGEPESVDSMKKAKIAGFNYFRTNLQITKDGVFVLWHDLALNKRYKNVYDGDNLVPYSDTDKIVISETNFDVLNTYKYGSTSAPKGIPTLEEMLKGCRANGMKLDIECKMAFTSEQIVNLYSLISKYAMVDKISVATLSNDNAKELANINKYIRVGLQYNKFTEVVKNAFIELTTLSNNVFWAGWRSMELTKEIVGFLSEHNIEYVCGSMVNYKDIDEYLAKPYAFYCTGMEIESDMSPLISKYIKNKY